MKREREREGEGEMRISNSLSALSAQLETITDRFIAKVLARDLLEGPARIWKA
jgi:hypothetical protein